MEIAAILILVLVLVFGGKKVEEKAKENTKDPVSGGLGCCAVFLWVVGIGFLIYCMVAVYVFGMGGN